MEKEGVEKLLIEFEDCVTQSNISLDDIENDMNNLLPLSMCTGHKKDKLFVLLCGNCVRNCVKTYIDSIQKNRTYFPQKHNKKDQ